MNNIIKKPILTEKATFDSEANDRFAFVVDVNANKIQIKNEIERIYGVTVGKVRTMRYGGGKAKRKYTAKGIAEQRIPLWKKAVVTVAEGEINLYENI
ncbi:50S ribosomal protein L23 [Paracrocinitomix mangrovi]|uniref:50S ribosomal protein L23 n=1 Tax=Paracrocinitomix mangrovi TaxID=2862509 RepID=UPI001C8D79E3|nr:50S ribosomal protein L23 [Paracrocinitomix mangrovi]UKN03181.1 50S ribosomal protein L23 [Paracrocinitomix mangrovi]